MPRVALLWIKERLATDTTCLNAKGFVFFKEGLLKKDWGFCNEIGRKEMKNRAKCTIFHG